MGKLSALERVGELLAKVARDKDLLKYGTGNDRMQRMLAGNPHLSVQRADPNMFYVGGTQYGPQDSPGMKILTRDSLIKDAAKWHTDKNGLAAVKASKDNEYGVVDMSGVKSGSGGLSALAYPLLGEQAKQGRMMILPDSVVTYANLPNRSMLTASTELTSKSPVFIPHEDQMPYGKLADGLSVEEYMGLPSEQRAAFLLDSGVHQGSQRLVDKLGQAMWDSTRFGGTTSEKAENFVKKYDIDINNPWGLESLGALVDPHQTLDELSRAAADIQSLGIPQLKIGEGTLRKASILNSLMEGKDSFNPDLVRGALYCNGGPVNVSKATRHVA